MATPDKKAYTQLQVAETKVVTSRSLNNDGFPNEVTDDNLEDGEEADIDADVYGATIFVLAFDLYELLTGVDHDGLSLHINVYRVLFVNALLLGNYCVQGGLLYWIYNYVALPQVQDARIVYQRFHAEVFHDGNFDEDLWNNWEESKPDVCNICFSNFTFMYTILALWWITMLIEINGTLGLLSKLNGLRHVQSISDTMTFREKEGLIHRRIVGLTSGLRALLLSLLIVPKTLIAVALLVVGSIWLAATDSITDLILNAITLNFVIGIDENLFEGFVPESMRKNIDLTTYFYPSSATAEAELKEKEKRQVILGYARSTFYLIAVMGGVYSYMIYGQSIPYLGVFPGFNWDVPCSDWWAMKAEEVCRPGVECFPKG